MPEQSSPTPRAEKPRLTEEEKSRNHLNSEHKRRGNIRQAFETLCTIVPGCEGRAASEGEVLEKTVNFINEQLKLNQELIAGCLARALTDKEREAVESLRVVVQTLDVVEVKEEAGVPAAEGEGEVAPSAGEGEGEDGRPGSSASVSASSEVEDAAVVGVRGQNGQDGQDGRNGERVQNDLPAGGHWRGVGEGQVTGAQFHGLPIVDGLSHELEIVNTAHGLSSSPHYWQGGQDDLHFDPNFIPDINFADAL